MNNREKLIGLLCFVLTFIFGLASVQAQQTATATANLTGTFVTSINVTFGGSGYGFAPTMTISGGGGSGAGAYTTISGGVVTSITVTNAGSGYTTTPLVTIQAPSTTPFGSSLVLDLPMDGTVVDTGPNHFTVTTNGGGVFVNDRFGFANAAFSLNGVNQNITLPFNALLYPTQFTLSAWVKFSQLKGNLFNAGNSATDGWRGYALELNSPNSTKFSYGDYNGSGYNGTMTCDITNFHGWCQLVLTRTTNSAAIFVNGVKINSVTGLTPYAKPQVAPLDFGASNGGGPFFNFCPVTFDSIHIYNRALADGEVQTLYTTESINTNAVPLVGVVVKTLRINMSQLVPSFGYQLQRTGNLISWTNVGNSFTATNTGSYQDFDIIDTDQGYFRILKLP